MKSIWDSAIGLLLITGGLLGLTLPFGKLAGAAGISPPLWAFVISLGAGGVLLIYLLATGQRVGLDTGRLRYFAVAAAISYAIPNLLMFSAIPHLGAGYTGIMFTLSPVITLSGEAGRPADLFWVVMGLLIPLSLAAGNIYRTIDWPKNAGTTELAVGSHLAAALLLAIIILARGDLPTVGLLVASPFLVAAQVAASALMFFFFFRLQSVGGPVYLSQIGYVGAAVGLISGVLFLGESYGLVTWLGAAVITVGIVMTTKAQMTTG
jgi:drug/metabolite transporter (DMT)-like permease